LDWQTSPYQTGWYLETNVTHDGVAAAQSGSIRRRPINEQSVLETSVPGPSRIGFWWKVSSRYWWDPLVFSVNDVEQARISGEVDWHWQSFTVPPGNSNQLCWIYDKAWSYESAGLDAAWLDQFTLNRFPLVTLLQPTNGAALSSSNVMIEAEASDPDGSVSRVEFYRDGILIGSVTNAPYSILWTDAPAGIYALTARAVDNLGDTNTSEPVLIYLRMPPRLEAPAWRDGVFCFRLMSVVGKNYLLEYKDFLSDSDWTQATILPGNNAVLEFTNAAFNVPQRFYRIHVQ
jgi:hypothetical protein